MSKLYVLDAIRAHLKARQLTYKDLALGLGLSEASVKRLFASADCSLERLEQICQFLQLEFADLFRSAPKKRALIAQLTHDQEVEFATHRHLLMVAVCALTLSLGASPGGPERAVRHGAEGLSSSACGLPG